MAVPPVPVLFSRFPSTLAAPGEPIPLPANAIEYDYEAELAVVIGRRTKHVSEAAALQYVFGYCNANDLSAPGLAVRHQPVANGEDTPTSSCHRPVSCYGGRNG